MKSFKIVEWEKGIKCTIYTVHFEDETDTEVDKFLNTYQDRSDFAEIPFIIDKILSKSGATNIRFENECGALPPNGYTGLLRLFCIKYSESVLLLYNGGIKENPQLSLQDNPNLLKIYRELQRIENLILERMIDNEIEIDEHNIAGDLEFYII